MENKQSGIVTFIVSHKVRPERVEEFEKVNRTLNKIAESAPGYLGINVIRSVGGEFVEYTVILRFDRYENLKKWSESAQRVEYVNCLRSISEHTSERLETGLEYWFTADSPDKPPRYKMALVTIVVIYPMVLGIPWLVSKVFGGTDVPFLMQVLVSVVLITLLMTYWAMPKITGMLSGWLRT